MNRLERAVRAELSQVCAHLMDAGLEAESDCATVLGSTGPVGYVLQTTAAWEKLLPRALDDLAQVSSGLCDEVIATRIPRRAGPSRHAYDYVRSGQTLAPLVWESRVPILEPARAPLAWLLHGLSLLHEELSQRIAVFGGALDEAISFREGSTFGAEDLHQLQLRSQELQTALDRSNRMRSVTRALAPPGLCPSRKPPIPFPRSNAWLRMRKLLRGLEQPESRLPSIARSLFVDDPRSTDTSYLYQRWCGWMLVTELRALGFSTSADPIPALLLSGAIRFLRGTQKLVLLCDPRFVRGKQPLHGISVQSGEATPDLVLTAEGVAGRITYVLDPTLSCEREARSRKRKYLRVLKVGGVRNVAGVDVLAGPQRSWAAAPLAGAVCEVDDWRGLHGTLPMNPCDYECAPLRAWLEDFLMALARP